MRQIHCDMSSIDFRGGCVLFISGGDIGESGVFGQC